MLTTFHLHHGPISSLLCNKGQKECYNYMDITIIHTKIHRIIIYLHHDKIHRIIIYLHHDKMEEKTTIYMAIIIIHTKN